MGTDHAWVAVEGPNDLARDLSSAVRAYFSSRGARLAASDWRPLEACAVGCGESTTLGVAISPVGEWLCIQDSEQACPNAHLAQWLVELLGRPVVWGYQSDHGGVAAQRFLGSEPTRSWVPRGTAWRDLQDPDTAPLEVMIFEGVTREMVGGDLPGVPSGVRATCPACSGQAEWTPRPRYDVDDADELMVLRTLPTTGPTVVEDAVVCWPCELRVAPVIITVEGGWYAGLAEAGARPHLRCRLPWDASE